MSGNQSVPGNGQGFPGCLSCPICLIYASPDWEFVTGGKETIGKINQCLSITHKAEKGPYSWCSLHLTWKKEAEGATWSPIKESSADFPQESTASGT